jgi:hypothetical protein
LKIAILTNFTEIHPGYSLSSLVCDQAVMLQSYGHTPEVFVCEGFRHHKSEMPTAWKDPIIREVVPKFPLTDFHGLSELEDKHQEYIERVTVFFREHLQGYDAIFTHDWVFTGWNLPFGQAILKVREEFAKVPFLHWVHSIPSGSRDFWNFDHYGPNHRIIYPNSVDRMRVANQFRTTESKVLVIPHIKDLRTFADLQPETLEFLGEHPEVVHSQFVQVYPASTDRLEAKRLREVILIFSALKQKGYTVCLVCANQHATKRQPREDVERYKKIARRNGLEPDREFVFTSDFKHPTYENGIPRKILRELMMYSNLLIYPTREETFGFVLPETVLMGGCLPVLNKSLKMMFEVGGFKGLYCDFGAFDAPMNVENESDYLGFIADCITARFLEDDCLQARTFHRQRYNYDSIYQRYYEPILAGTKLWM